MKNIIKILLILTPFIGFSQNFMPTEENTTSNYLIFEGRQYAFFKARGWNAADTNSVVVLNHGGVGETTAASMLTIEPMKYLAEGEWAGLLVKNNGDTIRFLMVGIKDSGLLNDHQDRCQRLAKYVVETLGMDTSVAKWRFIMTGLSQGAQVIPRTKKRNTEGKPYYVLFRRMIIAAPPSPYAVDWFPEYDSTFVRIHTTLTDGTTDPGYAWTYRNKVMAAAGAYADTIVHNAHGHIAWKYAFKVDGLTDPPGTHAPDSNEWRLMVKDVPYVPEPDPGGDPIRVRMRIRVVE